MASIDTTWSRVRTTTDRSITKRADRLLVRLHAAVDHADLGAATRLANTLTRLLEHDQHRH